MGALPEGYESPKSEGGAYMKLTPGANKFRILSGIKVGWEVWKEENGKRSPVRSKRREDLVQYQNDKNKIKFFWAMVVWNYGDEQVEILEITQKNIRSPLEELEGNPDWGDLRGYDITIKRSGEGLDTEYSVIPSPAKPLAPEVEKEFKNVSINLDALYTGDNPFAPKGGDSTVINPDDLPF